MTPTNTPAFSLLIPVYVNDQPEMLLRALTSTTTEQTLPPNEVVLVQDGPVSRELAATIETFRASTTIPVKHVVLAENVGLAGALQAGLTECTHDVVARMDADDVSLPNRFALQLPFIAEGYEYVGAAMFEYEDDPAERVGTRVPPEEGPAIYKHVRYHNPFNHPTVVFHKESVLRAGGYRAFGPTEDYWLVARILAAGLRVRNVLEPLVIYRVTPSMYGRRGGWVMYRYEMKLQRFMLRAGLTSRFHYSINVVVKFVFRLIPASLRRLITRGAFRFHRLIFHGKTGFHA